MRTRHVIVVVAGLAAWYLLLRVGAGSLEYPASLFYTISMFGVLSIVLALAIKHLIKY